MKKRIFSAAFGAALSLMALVGCGLGSPASSTPAASQPQSEVESTPVPETVNLLSGTYNCEIEVEGYGTIAVELDADTAPVTVTNFVNLVDNGFYDGLTFHRVISGFMVQGGDPAGNGSGSSGSRIVGEFASNGVENTLLHTRGVISMARSPGDNDSASCQFFIVHADSPHLDGDYAAFGHVTSGMEVVDAICEDTPVGNNGAVSAADQPVITSIKMV